MLLTPNTPNAARVARALTEGSVVTVYAGTTYIEVKSRAALSAVDEHLANGGSVSIDHVNDDDIATAQLTFLMPSVAQQAVDTEVVAQA